MEQEVIFDIKIDEGKAVERLTAVNKEIAELKQQNKDLAKQIKESGDVTGELTKKMVDNEKAVNLLKGEQKSLVGQLQQTEKANVSLGDSYNEISARLSQMQKEYKSLSAEQRNSEGGKALLKQIGQQKQALKDIDATMGDFQRNVGNYPKVMGGAFGKVEGILQNAGISFQGLATNGLGGFQNALGATGTAAKSFGNVLLTTPLGWIQAAVTAIVAIFDRLKEAFKKNDAAGTSMKKMMAGFQPILKFINKLFDDLVGFLGKVAEKIANLMAAGDAEVAALQELVTATDALEEKERQYVRSKAKNEAEIAKLREQANDSEEYTTQQRMKFLEEAQKLEEENLKGAIAIQKEKIRLREAEAKNAADTSDETMNEINEMYAELDRYERDYQNSKRTLQKNMTRIRNEETAEIKAQNDAQQKLQEERIEKMREAAEEEERIAGERLKIQDEISKALEDAIIENMEEGTDKQLEEINKRYDREIEALKEKYKDTEMLTEKAQNDLTELIALKETERANKISEVNLNAEKVRQERIDALRAEIQQAEDEKNAEDEEYQYEQRQEKLQRDIDELRERELALGEAEIEEKALIGERIQQLQEDQNKLQEEQQKKAQKREQDQRIANFNGFASVMKSVNELSDAFGIKSKALAVASKGIALGEIAINQGKAIAAGVAQAQSMGPFPANLAAIATTVSTILSTIAMASKAVKGAEFATGGIVGGNSFSGDNVQVNVNSGEMILNRQQQQQLFDIANGGRQASGINYEALAEAMSAMPAPILDYQEFTNFQQETITLEERAAI